MTATISFPSEVLTILLIHPVTYLIWELGELWVQFTYGRHTALFFTSYPEFFNAVFRFEVAVNVLFYFFQNVAQITHRTSLLFLTLHKGEVQMLCHLYFHGLGSKLSQMHVW